MRSAIEQRAGDFLFRIHVVFDCIFYHICDRDKLNYPEYSMHSCYAQSCVLSLMRFGRNADFVYPIQNVYAPCACLCCICLTSLYILNAGTKLYVIISIVRTNMDIFVSLYACIKYNLIYDIIWAIIQNTYSRCVLT